MTACYEQGSEKGQCYAILSQRERENDGWDERERERDREKERERIQSGSE